jgi:glycosyltransferase involved in cell wall biosynthesis
VLIEPRDEEHVVSELAKAIDLLNEDAELAERMSIAARKRALDGGYLWSEIIRRWVAVYKSILKEY